jgi:hypothetical protein
MGGHMLALLNVSDAPQSYRLERRVGALPVHDETVALGPGEQLTRVFGCRTDEVIELRASGGPMATQTLRWDPFMRWLAP